MRIRTLVAWLLLLAVTSIAAESYLKTDSYPRLRIKSVAEPQSFPPLQVDVTVEISAKGKSPLALSQEQFSIHFFDINRNSIYVSDASFSTNAPKIFTVSPEQPCTVTMTTSTNHFRQLAPGSYSLRVFINSDKTRHFDYQWLGQNSTDDHNFVIK